MIVVSTDLLICASVGSSQSSVGLYQRCVVAREATVVRGVSWVTHEDDQTSPVLEN